MQKIKSLDKIIFKVVDIKRGIVTVVLKGNALGRDFEMKPLRLMKGDNYEVDIRFEANG